MTCDRCFQPLDTGEHGWMLCPLEPRRGLFPNVIGDDIPGGMTIHNMSDTPETFYSKSDHRRRCKELGIVVRDRHVGHDHTDKSPFTSRWV